MIALRRHFSLFLSVFILASCQEKEKKTDSQTEDSFFKNQPAKEAQSLQNRMAEAPTDYLKTYADIPLPFQPWNPEILSLAEKTQKTIFVYIASASTPFSRDVAKSLFNESALAEEFSEQFICSVVSIEQAPEMALIGFHLASEIKQSVNFPMLLWLTHEGNPIAWLPFSAQQDKEALLSITKNSSVMVQDIWKNSSRYAIENSRRDNNTRQQRLHSVWEKAESASPLPRKQAFINFSREYISLYNPIEQNFDGAGGFLPTRNISFTAFIAQHPALSENTRTQARTALSGVLEKLRYSAMHDPVDGGYFLLSRNNDWSLPLFTKNLPSQTALALAFFQAAEVLGTSEALQNATDLLSAIEKNMKLDEQFVETISSRSSKNEKGLFIWSLPKLENILSQEEFQLARQVFHLEELGNIKLEPGSNRNYFRLSTLSFQDARHSELLKDSSNQEIYQNILRKLRDLRQEKSADFFTESKISAASLASVVRLHANASKLTDEAENLAKAQKNAAYLVANYLPKDKTPLRYPNSAEVFRGIDYAHCILAFCDLYRVTLDSKWLQHAEFLATNALENLSSEDGGQILEAQKESRVTQIGIFDSTMIFNDSSLALLETGLAQLFAITGDEKFGKARQKIWPAITHNIDRAFFIKADALQASAFEDDPLVCVLHGKIDDPKNLAMREILQNSLFAQTSVLTTDQDFRASELPKNEQAALTILRDGKILAEMTDPAELDTKMRQLIAAK